MKISILYVVILSLVVFPIHTFSQNQSQNIDQSNASNVDVKNVNIDEMSDSQVRKIIQEMQKRGLSEDEAVALAKARGVSQNQIDKLLKRIQELKNQPLDNMNQNGITDKTQQNNTDLDFLGDNLFSQKKQVDSAKVDKNIFGFHFFNNENLTFEPNVNIPIPPSYVLGAGDEILIDIWGVSEKNYQADIDRNGTINIEGVGPINVGGMTLQDAQKKIKQKLSSIYSDLTSANPRTFISTNVGVVKAIKVNVIGEVFLPGTYTLLGTASEFNALYLAGRPNINGSFRDIQVIREGKVIRHLDVYDFLINGKSDVNITLRDDDVIMVPTYINRVKVAGQFKRVGIFEAKKGESMADMIRFAGGFTENAYTNRLELYRNTDREKQFKNVFKKDFGAFSLENGDSIYAGEILDRFENKVSITGAVFRPGDYELTDSLTLKDLIKEAEGVREDAFMHRGIIVRLNPDLSFKNISFDVSDVLNGKTNFKLHRDDAVTIQAITDLREERVVNISGEVKMEGEYKYRDNMTLSDLIFVAGGFLESATEASIKNTP